MTKLSRLRRRLLTVALVAVALTASTATTTRPAECAASPCTDSCWQQYYDCLYYLGSSYQTMCAQRRDYCLMHCN